MGLEDIEFVITAPGNFAAVITYENLVRQTHGVLVDMFMSAKKYIVIASPYLKDLKIANPHLQRVLMHAMSRGVHLSILSTKSAIEEVRLGQYDLKNTINLYVPVSHFENDKIIGSHAKFCIVDGKYVYLGSANFTFSGLNKQFEMGIYSEGKLAKQVESFWEYLRDNRYIIRYWEANLNSSK